MKKFNFKLLASLGVGFLLASSLTGCNKDTPKVSQELLDFVEQMNATYQSKQNKTVQADFELISKTVADEVNPNVFTIDWSISGTSAEYVKAVAGKDKKGEDNELLTMIDVNDESDKDVTFSIKGVAHLGDESAKLKDIVMSLAKFKSFTWEEYVAACKDSGSNAGDEKNKAVALDGIITAMSGATNGATKNTAYVQDLENKGGFYVYNLQDDPWETFSIGEKVRVRGESGFYSGTYEVLSPTMKSLDNTTTKPNPVDFTSNFTESGMADAIENKQGLYVTIKDVIISPQDSDSTTNGYYKFSKDGVNSYLRISGSVCPITKDKQDTMIAAHNENVGHLADVKGLICVYSDKGTYNLYLTPCDDEPFDFKGLPPKTDAEAVAYEKTNLTTSLEITKNQEVTLPTTGASYQDVAISWASNSANAVVDGGKVTYTIPSETTTIKLTATLSRGDVSDTKEFDVKLIADKSSIAAAIAAGEALTSGSTTEDSYLIIGTVSSIKDAYSDQYKNISFFVSDGTMEILVFRYNLEDASTIAVDDFVAIAAPIKNYSGTIEAVSTFVALDYMSIPEVYALCTETNTTEATIYGCVKSIKEAYSAQYDNIRLVLTDGKNDIEMYRMAGGSDLAVGDWISVTGTPTIYSSNKQFAQGATYSKEVKYVAPEPPYEASHAGTEADPYDVADALGLGAELSKTTSKKDSATNVYVSTYGDTVKGYFKGFVVRGGTYNEAKGSSPACQKQFYLGDTKDAETTAQLQVYIANFANDITEVYQNDEVVVYGTLLNYNGTIEISNVDTYKDDATAGGKVVDTSEVPEFIDRTVGTSSVTLGDHDHANVSFTEGVADNTATNGTTIKFTVAVDSGYQINKVKVNGEEVTDTNGVYSCEVTGNVVVSVVAGEAGVAVGETKTYTFSSYTAGTQYADETHVLDENNGVSVHSVQCHFTAELRIYSSDTHNGVAIISSEKVITNIQMNVGNKVDVLDVFASTDGSSYSKVTGITTTEAYADTEDLALPENTKFIKLDVEGTNQVRIKSITLTFAPEE